MSLSPFVDNVYKIVSTLISDYRDISRFPPLLTLIIQEKSFLERRTQSIADWISPSASYWWCHVVKTHATWHEADIIMRLIVKRWNSRSSISVCYTALVVRLRKSDEEKKSESDAEIRHFESLSPDFGVSSGNLKLKLNSFFVLLGTYTRSSSLLLFHS